VVWKDALSIITNADEPPEIDLADRIQRFASFQESFRVGSMIVIMKIKFH
jgi:hypothetical protein